VTDPTHSALRRGLVRALALLIPGTGRRRACRAPNSTAPVPRTASGLRLLVQPWNPPRLRSRRSRAALWGPPIEGDASPLVRPYLAAYERQERRTALEVALDGIHVGPWHIHGPRVATAVAA
jgi:hypothetical protein